MTERDITSLLKLLEKFRRAPERDGTVLNARESAILVVVRQWVLWYGRDELGMDL
jgi:hypothetical protein